MAITKKTVTSLFIVPTLGIDRKAMFDNKFINGFLGDINKEEYHEENVVFLLFKPEELPLFRDFLHNQYEYNKSIIDDYDYDGGYVVLVYTLDKQYEKDFKLIKQGKYSKVSDAFKDLFPRKVTLYTRKGHPEMTSLQWMIFEKQDQLVEFVEEKIDSDLISKFNLEVWPGFDEQKEVLDIDKIRENEL